MIVVCTLALLSMLSFAWLRFRYGDAHTFTLIGALVMCWTNGLLIGVVLAGWD